MTDSQYNYYMGYVGNVINDDVIYDGPKEINQLTYKYDAGNGFTAIISLEDSNSSGDTSSYGGAWQTGKGNHYAPDVVLGAGYTTGAWLLRGIGGYDSVVEEGAVKARIDADFGAFKAFLMGGWNTDGDKLNKYAGSYLNSNRSACPTNGADCGWGDWPSGPAPELSADPEAAGQCPGGLHRSKIFAATANVAWRPVKDLLIEPEVSYTDWDAADRDQWAGVLRFERKF